jgi:hypothetical protein
MNGAVLGGLLATGLAALALAASVGLGPATDADVRGLRVFARLWIAGIGLLGLVVVILAWTLDTEVAPLLGLALGLVMGIGAFGILVVLRGATPGPEGRSRAILLMALAEAISVLACIGLMVAVFLGEPA